MSAKALKDRRANPVAIELLEDRRLMSVALKVLASFNGTDGNGPVGALAVSGNTLVGNTAAGGAHAKGAVYSLPVTGGTPKDLISYNGSNGAEPAGTPVILNSTVYDTGFGSGYQAPGTLDSVPVSGGTPKVLSTALGTPGQSLAVSGNKFYGITEYGGPGLDGTLYSIPITGGSPTTLASFNTSTTLYYASGSGPVIYGNNLYMTLLRVGAVGGEVATIPITGGTLKPISTFIHGPISELTVVGSTLYGSGDGGASGDGAVYSLPVTGGTPTIVASFNGTDGTEPVGAPVYFNGTLYGTTHQGGANNDGVVYSVPASGGTPTVLVNFNQASGIAAESSLLRSANTLYGSQSEGGAHKDGTVFAVTGAIPFVLYPPVNQRALAGIYSPIDPGEYSTSSPGSSPIEKITWGDGSYSPYTQPVTATQGTLTTRNHTYAKPGTYTVTVQFVNPTGVTGQSSNAETFTVNVVSPAAIVGYAFNDTNHNGKRDAGEKTISGWQVYLLTSSTQTPSNSVPHTTTNADGTFSFTNIYPGTYYLRVVPPSKYHLTTPAVDKFSLSAGERVSGVAFGGYV